MVVFPNAKINLGLNITSKRPDGFHDIETLLYPVAFRDILEILPSETGKLEFQVTGLPVPGDLSGNLCTRAYNLLAEEHTIQPARMHLHKIIPMGAGLGGGSSDAAFTIKLLNDLFSIGLSSEQMMDYARRLGSDCPFFIENSPALATGRGDQLKQFSSVLSGYSCMIVLPPIHVNTAEAYAGVTPKEPIEPIREVLSRSLNEWKDSLFNDFQKTVFSRFPQVSNIKDQLYSAGAIYASMSGSGSAVYGIFHGEAPGAELFPGFLTWSGAL
ncbi:MAG: 4-(cytidine 5'-diphospho)-2-C-methyl-D-erythritol kinase [Bacteroidetes bacterium]|nr:4-(cytidine 5'-diphospho)-2-C-methyl-D-erythritol kinase [Bacteroidota bacterium]